MMPQSASRIVSARLSRRVAWDTPPGNPTLEDPLCTDSAIDNFVHAIGRKICVQISAGGKRYKSMLVGASSLKTDACNQLIRVESYST